MTCQEVRSLRSTNGSIDDTKRNCGLVLDVSPRLRSPPESADQIHKLAAVMFSKVLFFAAVVALTGSFSAVDAGKFATSRCGASG